MIYEAIFEAAYQAVLKNKQIVERGMSNTDEGIELYGRSSELSDFITN